MNSGRIKYNIHIAIEGEDPAKDEDKINKILDEYPGNWEIVSGDFSEEDNYGIIEIEGECLGSYTYYEGGRYEKNGDPGYPDEYAEELDYAPEDLEYVLKKELADYDVLFHVDEGSEW